MKDPTPPSTSEHPSTEHWTDRAACKGRTELFFSDLPKETRRAVRICGMCEVLPKCAEFARTFAPTTISGVWAGTTNTTRRKNKWDDLPNTTTD